MVSFFGLIGAARVGVGGSVRTIRVKDRVGVTPDRGRSCRWRRSSAGVLWLGYSAFLFLPVPTRFFQPSPWPVFLSGGGVEAYWYIGGWSSRGEVAVLRSVGEGGGGGKCTVAVA